ncbi:MAG: GGDEF domain-containing protein [Clostridium sp.]
MKSKAVIFMIASSIIAMGTVGTFINYNKSMIIIMFSILFLFFLVLAEYAESFSKLKYIFAASSFISLLSVITFGRYNFDVIASLGFFIPFIYAYLLPDLFSPILIGIVYSIICYKFPGDTETNEIIGKIAGIIFSAVSYAVMFHINRQLEISKDKYRKTSIIDSLTGVPNLVYTMQLGEEFLKNGFSLVTYILDIDNFKKTNDMYGHLLGNKVLIEVSRILKKETKNGVAGRLGGDEFIILVSDVTYQESEKFFKQLTNCLKERYLKYDPKLEPIKFSCSIGMAYAKPKSNITLEEILHNADLNMYYIKQQKINSKIIDNIEYFI